MCLTFKSMINFELICIKWVSFFCLWISNSLSTICWEGYLSFHHWTAFASSLKISYLSLYRFIFGLSLLSCWSLCLFHHQYHSVLIFGAPKNWCFWTVLLEKTLESPLDCKEMHPSHPGCHKALSRVPCLAVCFKRRGFIFILAQNFFSIKGIFRVHVQLYCQK